MDLFTFAVANARREFMSRWTADSDLDYADEPWARPERCATKGCVGVVTFPDREAFCTSCLYKRAQFDRAIKAGLPLKKSEVA